MTQNVILDRLDDPTIGLTPQQVTVFEEVVLAFETEWTPDRLGTLSHSIASHESTLSAALMMELVFIDMERQWAIGNRRTASDYLSQFPIGKDLPEIRVAFVAAECKSRAAAAETIHWDALAQEHPQITAEIREHFVAEVAKLRSSRAAQAHINTPPTAADETTIVDPMIGDFDRYRIEREVGRGGMGIVYQAYDRKLDRTVALKVPNAETRTTSQRDFVARLYEEARAAAKLVEHPHICSVFDVGELGGTHFISMAFISGPSLAQRLRQSGPLDPTQAIDITQQIAKALQAAHAQGVVHRDLKPANIMLNEHGEPIITDFGLATYLDKTTDENEETIIAGTPAYMSPEQADGCLATEVSDIYSLGVIFYEMLTGQRPNFGTTNTLLSQAKQSPRKLPSQLSSDASAKIDAVCEKMIAIRPSDRFQSMRDVAEAMERIRTRRTGRILAAASAAGLLLAILAAITISVATNHGEVKLEFHDKKINVEIDDGRYTIADAGKPKRLKPGKHELKLRVGGRTLPLGKSFTFSDQLHDGTYRAVTTLDGLVIAGSQFDVIRGKKHVLRVELVKNESAVPAPQAKSDIDVHPRRVVPTPLDQLTRDSLTEAQRFVAGNGNPDLAPANLVAVFGDSRWMHWHHLHRNALAFDSDGTRIASASWDGTVVVRSALTGDPLSIHHQHATMPSSIAWGPDKWTLLVGSADGRVHLLDLRDDTWKTLNMQHHDAGTVMAVRLSPQGDFVASSAASTCCWYSLTEDRLLYEVGHRNIRNTAISPDGTAIATCGGDNNVRLWDRDTGELLSKFRGEGGLINTVAFTPDGSSLAVGLCNTSRTNNARVRLLARGGDQWTRSLVSPGSFVWAVDFSDDGRYLAEGREFGYVHLWDTETWEIAHSFDTTNFPTRRENGKRSVQFSPSGNHLASAGADNAIHLWNVQGEVVGEPVFGRLHCTAVNHDASRIAIAGAKGTFQIWSLGDGKTSQVIRGHDKLIRAMAFSPDDTLLATAGDDGSIQFWHPATGKPHEIAQPIDAVDPEDPIFDLAFDPNRPRVTVVRLSGAAQCWDYETGVEQFAISNKRLTNALSVVYRPESNEMVMAGTSIAAGEAKGNVYFCNPDTGAIRLTVPANYPVKDIAVDSQGKRLAFVCGQHYLQDQLITSDYISQVVMMNADSGAIQFTGDYPAASVAFSNDGRSLVIAGYDGRIRNLDIASNRVESMQIGPAGGMIADAVFGPNDRHVITTNRNGTAYVLRIDGD